MSKAQVFSVVHVKNGFSHAPLDVESSKLTTFGTPGWKTIPFGIAPTPEEFQLGLMKPLEDLMELKLLQITSLWLLFVTLIRLHCKTVVKRTSN